MSKKIKELTSPPSGKQPLRYRLFLNPYTDMRFTTCPQCGIKTRQRKMALVVHIEPYHRLALSKICRCCYNCDLLIVHKDQLDELLTDICTESKPELIGSRYLVIGTLDQAHLKQGLEHRLLVQEMLEKMHGFKEVITFKLNKGRWSYSSS